MTTDMMETHLRGAENLLNNISIVNKQHVSKLLQPNVNQVYSMPYPNYINIRN